MLWFWGRHWALLTPLLSKGTDVNDDPYDLSDSRLFNSVGDKKSLWAKQAEDHLRKQASNPFSDKFDKALFRLTCLIKLIDQPPEYSANELSTKVSQTLTSVI